MDGQQIELSVGDVLQIGNRFVTVVDIDGEDVSFRIEETFEGGPVSDFDQYTTRPR